MEEQAVVNHFHQCHTRDDKGRYIVPLPRKSKITPLGESRSQAARRFKALELSLHSKETFKEFSDVMNEYFQAGHVELVPPMNLDHMHKEVYYLPMHAVQRDDSSTTKVCIVFDASAETSGMLLNE